MNIVKKISQEQIDKLESEKLEEIVVYTINFGSYQKISTTDKAVAYALWESVCGEFFELKQAEGIRYEKPHFKYKNPIEVKLSAIKEQVWKDQESAKRAYNAFKALTIKKSK